MLFFARQSLSIPPRLIKTRVLAGSLIFGGALVLQPALNSEGAFVPVAAAQATTPANFDIFKPNPVNKSRFDYSIWNEALEQVVLDFGPSTRLRAGRVRAGVGSRFVKGHKSAYRLEGSRFTFEFITDDYRQSLSDYRLDLQNLANDHDITKFPKDEQLAYWINLHNVAVLEKIAENYPVDRPERIKFKVGGQKYKLDDAPFLQVMGQDISLSDIRKNIVYSNWKDPSVIYGFFRGDIGSPSLSPYAYTGGDVTLMLSQNADDFVNSLRGFNLGSKTRNVSAIYEEAAPYYFQNWDVDLTAHLAKYAGEEAAADLAKPYPFRIDTYDTMIADLSGGERLGSSGAPTGNDGLSFETQRLLNEVRKKREYLIRRDVIGRKKGYVIIEDLVPEEDKQDPVE